MATPFWQPPRSTTVVSARPYSLGMLSVRETYVGMSAAPQAASRVHCVLAPRPASAADMQVKCALVQAPLRMGQLFAGGALCAEAPSMSDPAIASAGSDGAAVSTALVGASPAGLLLAAAPIRGRLADVAVADWLARHPVAAQTPPDKDEKVVEISGTSSDADPVVYSPVFSAALQPSSAATSPPWTDVVVPRAAAAALLASKLSLETDSDAGLLAFLFNSDLPLTEPVVPGFAVVLRRRDFLGLRPGAWLKDEVINMYLTLLCQRHARRADMVAKSAGEVLPPTLHIWNTFFFAKLTEDACVVDGATGARVIAERNYCFANVARWTVRASVDVAATDVIIVPVNLSNTHWALAALWPAQRRILYADSLGGGRGALAARIVSVLGRWHDDECADKRLAAPRAGEPWAATHVPLQPLQDNSYDCGVFMLMAADWVAAGLEQHLCFAQAHMPALRRYIALSCLRRRVD
jgi:hypothetical protein